VFYVALPGLQFHGVFGLHVLVDAHRDSYQPQEFNEHECVRAVAELPMRNSNRTSTPYIFLGKAVDPHDNKTDQLLFTFKCVSVRDM
jgi:hypothetical protein